MYVQFAFCACVLMWLTIQSVQCIFESSTFFHRQKTMKTGIIVHSGFTHSRVSDSEPQEHLLFQILRCDANQYTTPLTPDVTRIEPGVSDGVVRTRRQCKAQLYRRERTVHREHLYVEKRFPPTTLGNHRLQGTVHAWWRSLLVGAQLVGVVVAHMD